MRPKPSWLKPFQRLQWKLTFSYTLVTVAALLVVELSILLILLALLNSNFLLNAVIEGFEDAIVPQVATYLEQTPPDIAGLNDWLTTWFNNEPRGSGQRTVTSGLTINFEPGQQVFVLGPDGRLLAKTPPDDPAELGQPLDTGTLPQLGEMLPATLNNTGEWQTRYTTLPNGHLLLALPVVGQNETLLGAIVTLLPQPAFNWETLRPLVLVVVFSLVPFTLMAGLVGALFGFLTARALSRRFRRLSQTADAWSQGDFSAVVQDSSGDELGQLARQLNRMAEQLQNLLQTRQELATLEERNRLARDLHDSVKQQVFATAMQVGAARALLTQAPEAAAQHLVEAEALARQAQQELTGLIQELRPAALEGKGLAEALRDFTADFSRRTAIQVHLRVQGERPLPLSTEQALFLMAQEALANVARHSRAQTAEVRLAWENDTVTLTIKDDGRGFDPAQTAGGLGLHSMQERVEALDGRLIIESTPGKGTQVTAIVAQEYIL